MMSNEKDETTPTPRETAPEPKTEITGAEPNIPNKTDETDKTETQINNTTAPPNPAEETTEDKADSTAEEKKSEAPKPKPPNGDKEKKEEKERPARGMEDLLNKQNNESFKDAKKAVAETDTAKSVHGVLNAAYNNASGADPSKKTESVAQSAGKAAMTMGADTAKSAATAVRDMARKFSQQSSSVAPEPQTPSSEESNSITHKK